MELNEKVRVLQTIYAGALADHVYRLGQEGVLEKVTDMKRHEQLAGGKIRAGQMGITRPDAVFTTLSDIMGCANWEVTPHENGDGFTATASRCMLCAFAKRMGSQSPCRLGCLDPMEGMIKGLDEKASFTVESTLFAGSDCRVVVTVND
jgi:hypothetical protein